MAAPNRGGGCLLVIGIFALVWLFAELQARPWILQSFLVVVLVFGAWMVFGLDGRRRPAKRDAPIEPARHPPARHDDHFRLHTPDVRMMIDGRFTLDYADVAGERTQRVVDVKNLEIYGEQLYLNAFCHLRRDMRMFRCDRIASLIDQTTGEVIEGSDVEGWLVGKAHTDSRDPQSK